MEECEKRVLSKYRTRLANEIVVTGSFLSAFCDQSVLDEEMTKIVKSEDNYTAKAHKLLELLPKRGPRAFSTLMEILSITNPWLAEKMKSSLHEENSREAKLRFSSSLSDAASSIQGYGSSGHRNVDNDLKATAHQFVKGSLQHLTDTEQRTTERWLAEEMQKERRRQQFRSPTTLKRPPHEFQSSKEVQTEMKGLEFHELCEDLMIQIHGVDYANMSCDLSFKMLQKLILELIQRTQKMDMLFVQCLEMFDDTDRYALSLPDLINRTSSRQRELVRALMDDRRKIQRLTEERDSLENTVRRLEDDIDRTLKRQPHGVVYSQQMYLKKRKEIQSRYTMTNVTKHAEHKPKKHAPGSATGAHKAHDTSSAGATASASASPAASASVSTVNHVDDTDEVLHAVVSSTASVSLTPQKARVRFSNPTSARPGMSGRRRPGTAGSIKSSLKHTAK